MSNSIVSVNKVLPLLQSEQVALIYKVYKT